MPCIYEMALNGTDIGLLEISILQWSRGWSSNAICLLQNVPSHHCRWVAHLLRSCTVSTSRPSARGSSLSRVMLSVSNSPVACSYSPFVTTQWVQVYCTVPRVMLSVSGSTLRSHIVSTPRRSGRRSTLPRVMFVDWNLTHIVCLPNLCCSTHH